MPPAAVRKLPSSSGRVDLFVGSLTPQQHASDLGDRSAQTILRF